MTKKVVICEECPSRAGIGNDGLCMHCREKGRREVIHAPRVASQERCVKCGNQSFSKHGNCNSCGNIPLAISAKKMPLPVMIIVKQKK